MSIQIALDTNAYSAFLSGNKAIQEKLVYATDILLPVTVLGELYYGFYKGTKLRENLTYLSRFLRDKRVNIGDVHTETAQAYGQIQAKLKKAGKPIPSNDIWIAAICLEASYPLLTNDTDFQNIPDLDILAF